MEPAFAALALNPPAEADVARDIGKDIDPGAVFKARLHLRAAVPSFEPYPTETHFFDKLADDVFEGDFEFKDGALTVYDKPGFGAAINEAKLQKYKV